MDAVGKDTLTDMWVGVGYGSVAVPGLEHDRVLEARGEWPILYYRAELEPQDVEIAHGWAIGDLFRQRMMWDVFATQPGEEWEVLDEREWRLSGD